MAGYKVLLTASGLGSRLGSITDYTNKSLVRIGTKPAISYIVESYDESIPIVVTLGHFGNQVKDFLELVYPERIFEFVEIENYSGEGSSLGYSMLQAKEKLQCPFIFHACDTITLDEIPAPVSNWLAGTHLPEQSSQYRTLQVNNEEVVRINEKGEINFDLVYVGLAGIKDYSSFWKALESVYIKDKNNSSISDCHAFSLMPHTLYSITLSTWYDIGNTTSLKYAKQKLGSSFKILDKVDENIFIFEDKVVKFFYNSKVNIDRVKRVEYLNNTAPKILGYKENFYMYELAKGSTFSNTATPKTIYNFLNLIHNKLWSVTKADKDFEKVCRSFYIDKSLKRIKLYLKSIGKEEDSSTIINGEKIPPAEKLIEILSEKNIYSSIKTYFHGDFILDNVIETQEGFSLIDWRQDFGGELEYGDVYYDLAKLNHNLLFNHDLVNRDLYTIQDTTQEVKVDILISKRLLECRDIFHKFILDRGFDLAKVNMLTAMIWINMAPLHEYPLNKFLFNFGKYNLKKALDE